MERCQKQPTKANLAQLVEHHLAKVDVEGSSPLVRSISYGGVAQLVEQVTLNHWVHGSSPCTPTIKRKIGRRVDFFVFIPRLSKLTTHTDGTLT